MWQMILTSVIVSALVTQIFILIGQYLERKARKEDLLFNQALELGKRRTEYALRMAEGSGTPVRLQDDIVNTESYYQWLRYLRKHGKLPDNAGIQRLSDMECETTKSV